MVLSFKMTMVYTNSFRHLTYITKHVELFNVRKKFMLYSLFDLMKSWLQYVIYYCEAVKHFTTFVNIFVDKVLGSTQYMWPFSSTRLPHMSIVHHICLPHMSTRWIKYHINDGNCTMVIFYSLVCDVACKRSSSMAMYSKICDFADWRIRTLFSICTPCTMRFSPSG